MQQVGKNFQQRGWVCQQKQIIRFSDIIQVFLDNSETYSRCVGVIVPYRRHKISFVKKIAPINITQNIIYGGFINFPPDVSYFYFFKLIFQKEFLTYHTEKSASSKTISSLTRSMTLKNWNIRFRKRETISRQSGRVVVKKFTSLAEYIIFL